MQQSRIGNRWVFCFSLGGQNDAVRDTRLGKYDGLGGLGIGACSAGWVSTGGAVGPTTKFYLLWARCPGERQLSFAWR